MTGDKLTKQSSWSHGLWTMDNGRRKPMAATPGNPETDKLTPEAAVQRTREAGKVLKAEVQKVIVGQDQMIEEMLICLFARGHCLTIGVPGLAKTLTVSTLARALHLK